MVEMHFLRFHIFQTYVVPDGVHDYEGDLYSKVIYPVFGRLLDMFTGEAPVMDCQSNIVASPEKPDLYHKRCKLYLEEKRGTKKLTDWRDHEDSMKICEIASRHFLEGESHVFFWLGHYYPIEKGIMMQRALYIARPVHEQRMILRGIEMRLLHESSMSFASKPRQVPLAAPLITFGEWLVPSSIIAHCR